MMWALLSQFAHRIAVRRSGDAGSPGCIRAPDRFKYLQLQGGDGESEAPSASQTANAFPLVLS
jgi:hypothetical protein